MNDGREESKAAIVYVKSAAYTAAICGIIVVCSHVPSCQIQTPHGQMPTVLHFEQAIRPTTDDFWEDPLGVWNSRNIQHGNVR